MPKRSRTVTKSMKSKTKKAARSTKKSRNPTKSSVVRKNKKNKNTKGSILSTKSLLIRSGVGSGIGGSKLLGSTMKLGTLKKSQLIAKPLLEGTKRAKPGPMLRPAPEPQRQPRESQQAQQPQQYQQVHQQQQQKYQQQHQQYQQHPQQYQQQQQQQQQIPPQFLPQSYPPPYASEGGNPGGYMDQQQNLNLNHWNPDQGFVDPLQYLPHNQAQGFIPYESHPSYPGFGNQYPNYAQNPFDPGLPTDQPIMGPGSSDWDPYGTY